MKTVEKLMKKCCETSMQKKVNKSGTVQFVKARKCQKITMYDKMRIWRATRWD